jgi:hypothetical protein
VFLLCPCGPYPLRCMVHLLHVLLSPLLLAGDLWGTVNIHTHHVKRDLPPQCLSDTAVVLLAASCEVLFRLLSFPIPMPTSAPLLHIVPNVSSFLLFVDVSWIIGGHWSK